MAMDVFLADCKGAWRAFRAMRGPGLLAVLTLAIGIGAATTLASVVYGALLRPLPFADPDRLVALFAREQPPNRDAARRRWSWAQFQALRRGVHSVDVASVTGMLVAIR